MPFVTFTAAMPSWRKTELDCARSSSISSAARRLGGSDESRSVTSTPVAVAIACSSESLGSRLPFSMRLSWLPATPTSSPSSSRVKPCDTRW